MRYTKIKSQIGIRINIPSPSLFYFSNAAIIGYRTL